MQALRLGIERRSGVVVTVSKAVGQSRKKDGKLDENMLAKQRIL